MEWLPGSSSFRRKHNYMWKAKVLLGSLAIAGCLSALPGYGQNTNSADLRGTVVDAKGAVLAGATVIIKDVDKDLTRTFITDAAGLYETGPIVPDHYLVTFTAPGFKTEVRGPITLNVGTDTLNATFVRLFKQVDGGVDAATIEECARAGADVFVAGSAVYGAADPAAAVEALRAHATAAVESAGAR